MTSNTAAALTAALLSGVLTAGPALAIDASDVLDKMEPHERSSFLGGAVDMASHLYAMSGNRQKADCAVTWYFDDANSHREIHAFFDAHRDKDAVGLLSMLIDRRCGK
jgi:hypothetical protein